MGGETQCRAPRHCSLAMTFVASLAIIAIWPFLETALRAVLSALWFMEDSSSGSSIAITAGWILRIRFSDSVRQGKHLHDAEGPLRASWKFSG